MDINSCHIKNEENRINIIFNMNVHGVPKKMFVFEMSEVRIFWNTPSSSMDKINGNRHLLD